MKTGNCYVGEAGCAPVHSKVQKKTQNGGCYGSTELEIVVPKGILVRNFSVENRRTVQTEK
jgi:hypothetical protein